MADELLKFSFHRDGNVDPNLRRRDVSCKKKKNEQEQENSAPIASNDHIVFAQSPRNDLLSRLENRVMSDN